MESEIDQLRSKREYYTRRLNVTCPLTLAQMTAAVEFICAARACTREQGEEELARQRFVWEGMQQEASHVSRALEFKRKLLDAIESAAPLRNPCHDCYQKSPEAKADKRKRVDHAHPADKPVKPVTTAGGGSGKGKKVRLGGDLPAVTSDNTVVGRVLPDA